MPDEPKKSSNSLCSYSDDITRNIANGFQDLSAQKKAFAFAYLETYKIGEAAEQAGVSSTTGAKWFREPLVNAFITEIQSEYQRRSVVDADFVRTQWLQMLPKVMGDEAVPMVLNDGTQIEGRKFHASDATRVLTELSKSTKFYEGGSGNNGAVSININLDAMGISTNVKTEKVIDHEG